MTADAIYGNALVSPTGVRSARHRSAGRNAHEMTVETVMTAGPMLGYEVTLTPINQVAATAASVIADYDHHPTTARR
jgi:hypothetical protein